MFNEKEKAWTMAKAPKAAAVAPVSASTGVVTQSAAPAAEWSIEITQPPIMIGASKIVRLSIEPLTLVAFVEVLKAAENALRRAREPNDKLAKHYFRERMKRQLVATDESGSRVPITDADLLNMPRVWAVQARDAVELSGAARQGEILSDGDGISSPVHYKLGTPLVMAGKDADGKVSDFKITELEFMARTYGDIEDVLSVDGTGSQTLELVRTCAAPVDGPIRLQALPSWAVDQIMHADGLVIGQEILPRFLNPPLG